MAQLMEAKLAVNRHKGNREGWMNASLSARIDAVTEEHGELMEAVIRATMSPTEANLMAVAFEGADLNNVTMMLVDRVCNGLVSRAAPIVFRTGAV